MFILGRAAAAWAVVVGLALAACASVPPQSAAAESAPTNAPAHSDRLQSNAPAQRDRLQSITDEEANRLRVDWGARRVAIVMLDARTGALVATHDDAPGEPITPASTLKTLLVALALDADLITPQQRFDCGNGQRAYGSQVLHDVGEYGQLDVAEILATSSNVGASRIFDVLGAQGLMDGFRRFHLSLPSGIEDGSLRGAIIAGGEGSTTTPTALAAAYAVFANEGRYAGPNPGDAEQVIKASTARAVRNMLEGVVDGELGTGSAARVPGVRVGGKTGTSDPDPECQSCAKAPGIFANFVGIVPIEPPRWVIYVGVGSPTKPGSGGTIAAPAFARIATRALALPPPPPP